MYTPIHSQHMDAVVKCSETGTKFGTSFLRRPKTCGVPGGVIIPFSENVISKPFRLQTQSTQSRSTHTTSHPSQSTLPKYQPPTNSPPTPPDPKNGSQNHSNNRLLRRQAAETNPPRRVHELRNGIQPLPPTASDAEPAAQGARAHLLVRPDVHGRQLCGEGLLPAQGQPERDCGLLSGY